MANGNEQTMIPSVERLAGVCRWVAVQARVKELGTVAGNEYQREARADGPNEVISNHHSLRSSLNTTHHIPSNNKNAA